VSDYYATCRWYLPTCRWYLNTWRMPHMPLGSTWHMSIVDGWHTWHNVAHTNNAHIMLPYAQADGISVLLDTLTLATQPAVLTLCCRGLAALALAEPRLVDCGCELRVAGRFGGPRGVSSARSSRCGTPAKNEKSAISSNFNLKFNFNFKFNLKFNFRA
jgi:hypothetical protein